MRTLLCIALLCLTNTLSYSQNGIVGSGFTAGWNNPNDVISFDQSFGNSRIKILNPNGTGNQYFRFVKFWNFNNTEFGPCSDQDITSNVEMQINDMPIACGGAFYINCLNITDNYVFKSNDPDGDDVIYFRVQGAIGEVVSVSQPTIVYDTDAVTITATTDNPLNAGQRIFLRYTTDGFASSTVTEMTASVGFAAPQDYSAEIPALSEGTTVSYYVFTSGTEPAPSEADWYTINGNTNGGTNYSYTVQMSLPIELTEFIGQSVSDGVALSWKTATEINFHHFEIERRKENKWFYLGSVKPNKTTDGIGNYGYIDDQPTAGTNMYRLKSIDLDGSFEYSPAISVQHKTSSISVYPTAFTDFITVNGTTSGDQCYLFDVTGKLMKQINGNISPVQIPLPSLQPGTYFLLVRDNGGDVHYRQQIIKL